MTAWPSADLTKANLDAATDDPKQARTELESAIDKVNTLLGARSSANGIASLDSGGKVPTGELPTIPINKGGTGAITAAAARSALGAQATLSGDPAIKDSANTFTAVNKFDTTSASTPNVEVNNSDGSGPARLDMTRKKNTPAADTVLVRVQMNGYNALNAKVEYAAIEALVKDNANGAHEGALKLQTYDGGAVVDAIVLNPDGGAVIKSLLLGANTLINASGELVVGGNALFDNFLNASAGSGDAGKPVKLNASGKLDSSMIAGAVASSVPVRVPIWLPGIVSAATDGTNFPHLQKVFTAPADLTLNAIQFNGCGYKRTPTGNTTIVLYSANYSGYSTGGIELTIADTAVGGERATGSIAITGGNKFYVFVTGASGTWQDPQFTLEWTEA